MKKVFIFLPDGVGLKSFALTNFKEIGEAQGFDVTYWNNTPFSIEKELGRKVDMEDVKGKLKKNFEQVFAAVLI